jgi:ankyrin repeat protein
MSRLVYALKSEDAYLVKALLASGDFFIDFQDPETGGTALMFALETCTEERFARELIRRGANVELANADGTTPLMAACVANFFSAAEEIALQVRDLDVSNNNGMTAVCLAVQCSSLKIVQLLVRCGASVMVAGFGTPVFHQALYNARLETAEYLLTEEFEGLFSVHHRDVHGYQPMHVAASGGRLNAVEWLNRRGAAFDVPGFAGDTPLMHAARRGHLLVAHKLLLWGADPSRVDDGGGTARSWAEKGGHGGVVALLDAWRSVQAVWVVRFAGEVRRVAPRSEFKRLPYDMNRMLGKFLV